MYKRPCIILMYLFDHFLTSFLVFMKKNQYDKVLRCDQKGWNQKWVAATDRSDFIDSEKVWLMFYFSLILSLSL